MDQIRIGSFLKELRKEKCLTQEELAEKFGVSNRTVSRWETGSSMPDISMLLEIADFYGVSIPEIIGGEKKEAYMNQETRQTAAAMAAYSEQEVKSGKRSVTGILLMAFGLFVILSALMVFPSESSWGSIYAVLGSIFLVTGLSCLLRLRIAGRGTRIAVLAGCIIILFGTFSVSDYAAVSLFHQVPRFRYETIYSSEHPDQLVYKTLFFTAVQENPGTEQEDVHLVP